VEKVTDAPSIIDKALFANTINSHHFTFWRETVSSRFPISTGFVHLLYERGKW
jgi:hypothetical protein